MKTLKKLTLKQLEQNFFVIDNEEKRKLTGGVIDNFCYFNCLDYLSNYYNCGYSANYYMNAYGSTYGYGEVLNGPSSYGNITNFNNSYFDTSGATFSPYVMQQTVGYSPVLAIIPTSNASVQHAVILNSYNNGTFSYYDPTTGTYGTISSSAVIYGMGILGCR